MKILHTSDWHLGRTLYGRKRSREFAAFLDWLAATIHQQGIDTLLVAGDIFDTGTPSYRAQELYYRFLFQMAGSSCRHIIITAGNHDSPSFLNAPQSLLRLLNIHVIGNANSVPEHEVLTLHDRDGTPELLVCAVPFLRDRDIRTVEAGESLEDKGQKLLDGIRAHYAAVAAAAEQKRVELGKNLPIIGMGHLFTAGGKTLADDGVRELHVGTLTHVPSSMFPPFAYLALGHLHIPQTVGGMEHLRYSGSPLPMGFGEARQTKSVCLVTFTEEHGNIPEISLLPVPAFQPLESIKGDWTAITRRIQELTEAHASSWLEVIYDADEITGDLRGRLEELLSHTRMELLSVKNIRSTTALLEQIKEEETLTALDVTEVFERCLSAHQIPEIQRPDLRHALQEILASLPEGEELADTGEDL